jgi:hypothetical protein
MRHRIPERHPRLAHSRVMAGVVALLAVIAVAAGCPATRLPFDAVGLGARAASRPRALRRRWRVHAGPRADPGHRCGLALMQLGLRVDGSAVPPVGFPQAGTPARDPG